MALGARITSVDGEKVDPTATAVEMPPGPHTLRIGFSWRNLAGYTTASNRECSITFVAEPGRKYTVMAGTTETSWRAWLREDIWDKGGVPCLFAAS